MEDLLAWEDPFNRDFLNHIGRKKSTVISWFNGHPTFGADIQKTPTDHTLLQTPVCEKWGRQTSTPSQYRDCGLQSRRAPVRRGNGGTGVATSSRALVSYFYVHMSHIQCKRQVSGHSILRSPFSCATLQNMPPLRSPSYNFPQLFVLDTETSSKFNLDIRHVPHKTSVATYVPAERTICGVENNAS